MQPSAPHRRTACLIYNPVAGRGDPEMDLWVIRSYLEPEIDLQVLLTTPLLSAGQLARQAVDRGLDLVIAAGGDGTLSAVAEVLVGSDIPFGVISRGTANAFAAALGLPLAIEAACETILDGHTRRVDAARCNELPMVLLAGVGFEAETVARTSREAKQQFGPIAYLWAGLQQLSEVRPFQVEIETPQVSFKTAATAVTIANAAPLTSVLAQGRGGVVFDDGLLDVTVVAPNHALGALSAVVELYAAALRAVGASEASDIAHLRTPWVRVHADPPQPVVIDGEVTGQTPLTVTCLPGGLQVIVPAELNTLAIQNTFSSEPFG